MRKVYAVLFTFGLMAGILLGLNKARASTPVGEVSTGGGTTYYYDEYWKAIQALVSTTGGYDLRDIAGNQNTPSAGILDQDSNNNWYVRLFPKMVVTKWRVHGHIHM